MVENLVWHERGTPKAFGEQFAEDIASHLPPPVVELFAKPLVALGGFVRFHS